MKTGTIRQRVLIPSVQPLEVYNALMNPKIHSAFTGSKATMNPRPGGKFTAWGDYITGKNLELVEGKKLVQEWKTSEWPEDYPSSILELIFTAKPGGTEIKMVHSKVPASQVAQYRSGLGRELLGPDETILRGTAEEEEEEG